MNIQQLKTGLYQIADELRDATYYETLEKTAKDSIYKEHGIDGLKDERLISDAVKTLETNLTLEARAKVEELQAQYKKDHETLVNKHHRAIVRTHSGITVAERYAKDNGITLESALTELNAYARTKTGNFTETPGDRYAAIVSEGITQRGDVTIIHNALQAEKKLAGLAEMDETIKTGSYLLSNSADKILKDINSSGGAILRSLEQSAQK